MNSRKPVDLGVAAADFHDPPTARHPEDVLPARGDVHVEPAEDQVGVPSAEPATTLIAFGTPRQGYALLEAPTGKPDGFLDRSFAAVPEGEESRRIDRAACIARPLGE